MAKKKVTPNSQSQSTDPKKLSPPPTMSLDDPSIQIQKQVSDLTIRLENAKVQLSTVSQERDKVKGEAENREKKVKEEVEKMGIEAQKLFEEKREKEKMIVELKKERDLAVRNSKELKEKVDVVKREKNEVEMVNTAQGKEIFQFEREVGQLNELLENSRNQESLLMQIEQGKRLRRLKLAARMKLLSCKEKLMD